LTRARGRSTPTTPPLLISNIVTSPPLKILHF
jgi:hypothetical protein